jgi:hypothetical protein
MKASYDYDFYFVDVLPKGGTWNSIKHDDDGDWGWQRVEVTPGTTYTFRVQGCASGLFGNPCSGWSPEATVTIDLPYGPDTCKLGFVWRDGTQNDRICVTPERRQKVADDFNTARTRTQPRSGNPMLDVGGECLPVLKSSGETVIVCVDQKEADLLKQENANPTANRVNP